MMWTKIGTGFGIREWIEKMNMAETTKKRESGGPFKRCSLCGAEWQTRDEFLADKTLKLNGYQGSLRRLRLGEMARGLLLFTHKAPGCGTTLALEAKRFKDESVEA